MTTSAGTTSYQYDGDYRLKRATRPGGAYTEYWYEFGVLTQSTGQSWNSFKYTSSIYDSAPDLYLMGARYYDPALGRFITQDTWEGRTWEPWTKNLYAYGRGNPVNYVDPTGHNPLLPLLIGLALKLAQDPAVREMAAEAFVVIGLWAFGVHEQWALSNAVEELGGTEEVARRPAEEVNAWLAEEGYPRPPFEPGTTVFELWTTADIESTARREDIKELTRQEIQSKYALPRVPAYVANATLPAGSRLWIGIAARQRDWGAEGGGIQIYVIEGPAIRWDDEEPLVDP